MKTTHSIPTSKTSAFTLIELLTVIAIIGILAAITIPTVSKVRESANTAKCGSNLRQIAAAAILYGNENRDRFPGYHWFRPDPGKPGGQEGGITSYLSLDAYDSTKPPYDTILTCPTAQRIWPTHYQAWTYNRTYSINGWLRSGNDASNNPYPPPHRFSELAQPSRTAFFMDSINQDSFVEGRGYFHWVAAPVDKTSDAQDKARTSLRNSKPYIHGSRINIAFADGHLTSFKRPDLEKLLWMPYSPIFWGNNL